MKAAMLEDSDKSKGAKPRTAAAIGAVTAVRSWPSRTKTFLSDVRTETKRVTWPNFTQIRGTTIVVILTVFFFGVYFGILDWIFNHVIPRILRLGS